MYLYVHIHSKCTCENPKFVISTLVYYPTYAMSKAYNKNLFKYLSLDNLVETYSTLKSNVKYPYCTVPLNNTGEQYIENKNKHC